MKSLTLPPKEEERLAALHSYNVLDTPREEAFDDLTRLAAQICRAPIAVIGFMDRDRYWIKSALGLDATELPREQSFAAWTLLQTEPLVVEDALEDERFRDLPKVQGESRVRFYAGVPLCPPSQPHAVGALCVMDHEPRRLTDAELEALRILGHQVVTQLELRRNFIELEVSIASHLRAEEALRQAEEKYRGIFENVMEGIFQTTPDGHYLSANPMLARIYGFESPAKLIEAIADIGHQLYVDPERREEFRRLIRRKGTVSRFESQVYRKDKRIIWISETARAVKDKKGELLYYEGTVEEITERKRAEEALRDSEVLYHSLVECLPQSIFRKDRQGRFTFANGRFCEVVGRPVDEIVGKTDYDLFPPELASKYQEDDHQVMATHQSKDIIEENRTKDRGTIHVQVVKTPLYDADGRVVGIQGIFWDVTEKRKMEEAVAYERDLLRTLLDNIPDRIYFKDKHSHFIRVGKALARQFGLADPELAVGKTDFDFFSDEHAQAAFKDEQSIIESGQPIVGKTEKENWAHNGSETWALTTKMPFRNRAGEIIGTFGVSKDITPLKQAETELARARDIALDSARMKSEFLANMSHEIRTPMNCLIGMTDLLMDTELTDEQWDSIRTIRTSADALLTIINDILDFSKIEAGKLAIEMIEFDLLETVENVIDLFAERAETKGVELSLWMDTDLPRHVRGDPHRIRQVLTNLLGNATKFTAEGSIRVRVSLLSRRKGQSEIKFSVSDTGVGIEAQVQSRLFQAFTQADGSLSRRYGGTGLGLAISRQLVELMGGTIDMDSQLGEGSTFHFTLLFDEIPNAAPIIGPNPLLTGKRLLVADSSATSREVITHYTQALGLDNESTATAPEIVPLLRSAAAAGKPIDLVVLDLQIPGMDGLSVVQEIRSDPKFNATRLIIVTSLNLHLDAKAWRTAGIDAYLVKPIKLSRLIECLHLAWDRSGTHQAGRTAHLKKLHGPQSPGSSPSKGIRILVAEDNVVNQKIAIRQLRKLGYLAEPVDNGHEAVESVRTGTYPIVLMDCQMPGLDGYEATRRIRQHEKANSTSENPPVYIIAMTANAMESNRDKCLAIGMNDYVSKPVKLPELQAALQRATGSPFAAASPTPAQAEPAAPQPASEEDVPVLEMEALDSLRALQEPDEEDMVAELIRLFLADTPPRVEGMKKALETRDADALRKAAHALKGTARNLGARRLAAQCLRLEKLVRANDFPGVESTLSTLVEEFRKVCFVLEEEARK